jgi:hypothetical protein
MGSALYNVDERKQTVEATKTHQTKREWKTPELIVLVRSTPEEAVLVSCKGDVWTSPNNEDTYCTVDQMCSGCNTITIS